MNLAPAAAVAACPDWFDRARKAVGQFDGDAGKPQPAQDVVPVDKRDWRINGAPRVWFEKESAFGPWFVRPVAESIEYVRKDLAHPPQPSASVAEAFEAFSKQQTELTRGGALYFNATKKSSFFAGWNAALRALKGGA